MYIRMSTVLQTLYRTTCINRHPTVKNWKILLEQSFTAHMPLMTATSTFVLRRRCQSSPRRCYPHTAQSPYHLPRVIPRRSLSAKSERLVVTAAGFCNLDDLPVVQPSQSIEWNSKHGLLTSKNYPAPSLFLKPPTNS